MDKQNWVQWTGREAMKAKRTGCRRTIGAAFVSRLSRLSCLLG